LLYCARMKNILRSVRGLKAEGKLQKRLVIQIRILMAISLVLMVVVTYQVIAHGLDLGIVLALTALGFALGLLVFSKMNKLVWNEEEEVIQSGRMEILGFVILALYIGFEIGLRTLLNNEFPGSFAAIAYLLAAIGSSLFGRSVGTLIAIRKLDKKEGISS